MKTRTLEDAFGPAFEAGITDISLTVRRGSDVSVEDLTREAIAFQDAINEGRVTQIASVD